MEHHHPLQTAASWMTCLATDAAGFWLAATCVAFLVFALCRLTVRLASGRTRLARRIRIGLRRREKFTARVRDNRRRTLPSWAHKRGKPVAGCRDPRGGARLK